MDKSIGSYSRRAFDLLHTEVPEFRLDRKNAILVRLSRAFPLYTQAVGGKIPSL